MATEERLYYWWTTSSFVITFFLLRYSKRIGKNISFLYANVRTKKPTSRFFLLKSSSVSFCKKQIYFSSGASFSSAVNSRFPVLTSCPATSCGPAFCHARRSLSRPAVSVTPGFLPCPAVFSRVLSFNLIGCHCVNFRYILLPHLCEAVIPL